MHTKHTIFYILNKEQPQRAINLLVKTRAAKNINWFSLPHIYSIK